MQQHRLSVRSNRYRYRRWLIKQIGEDPRAGTLYLFHEPYPDPPPSTVRLSVPPLATIMRSLHGE